MCHNPTSSVYSTTKLALWESASRLDTVEQTTAYTTTVGRPNGFLPDLRIIEPGRPDESELIVRISERGTRQMPPLATKIIDPDGISEVRAWVQSLSASPDAGPPDAGPRDAAPDR